ncbi:hypothetical protein OSTOST_25145, partial [Ostertagia ostertagi]
WVFSWKIPFSFARGSSSITSSNRINSDRLPPNVHLFKWIPQADLLRHPKTIAFISHGGYNSLQEVIAAGVPLITIALWGDQPRNAKLAAKLGIAFNLQKSDISATTITDALNKVINDRR